MVNLPKLRNLGAKKEVNQFSFKGVRHSEGARDGEIYDMENISLDDYPSMSVRKARRRLPFEITGKVYGIGSADKLFWCSEASGGDSSSSTQNDSGEATQNDSGEATQNDSGEATQNDSGEATQNDSGEATQNDTAEGNVWFYYDGEAKFPVTETEKTFTVVNKYVCIFPDKKYFSLWGDEAVNLKGEEITLYTSLGQLYYATEEDASLKDGDVYAVGEAEPYSYFQFNSKGEWPSGCGASRENHAVQTRWIYLMDSWGNLEESVTVVKDEFDTSVSRIGFSSGDEYDFDGQTLPYIGLFYSDLNTSIGINSQKNVLPWVRIGDTVKIVMKKENSGEKIQTAYAKIIAKELNPDYIGGYPYMVYGVEPAISTTWATQITISREIPDLEYSFCHDNRLWGVEKDKIYASKLGDPFNFYDYSLIADASWSVGIASSEPFTGAIAYNGYPTFFKEDRIIKVSGNYPAQYSTYETADVPGVMAGSGKSLAIANGYLYYLSPEGVCAYSGSYPTVIGEDLGVVLKSGYGGAGADKYFLECEILRASPQNDRGVAVYVYDTRTRAWTKENALGCVGFTDIGRDLYALTEDGIYLLDSVKSEGEAEEDIESFVEFAPIYDGHLKKKGVSRLHVSLKADEGAEVSFYISYDGGEWKKVKEVTATERKNFNIPLTVRRCGYYQLKIEGIGSYTVYAIGREWYFGSEY